eukprot:m.124722 g.124722  ORF g.124722 m.124722 type:complete len:104 (-) comp13510_c0_seq2:411-722(-)
MRRRSGHLNENELLACARAQLWVLRPGSRPHRGLCDAVAPGATLSLSALLLRLVDGSDLLPRLLSSVVFLGDTLMKMRQDHFDICVHPLNVAELTFELILLLT